MVDYIEDELNMTLTENGATTYASTGSDCLDLFSAIGALRSASDEEINKRFVRAYAEDKDIAMKLLFYARDIRGGLGERRVFRTILKRLAHDKCESVKKNMGLIAEFGRYDDLLVLMDTPCEDAMLELLKAQFDEYDGYDGNSIPFVPSATYALGANYRMDCFSVGADLTGQGYTEWNEANTFGQKAYVLLGAHVGYDFGSWNIKLWGRNLTDTKYNTFAVESKAAGQPLRFAQLGNPLQLGIDLNVHF
jgi:hypothetical protein